MKALVTLVGAVIGIAASLVVLSFQLALSPLSAFLVLAGVGLWLRDVRRSSPGSRGPNWRSFFFGSAIWIALPIALLLFKNVLASVPASAVSASAIGIGMIAFGIAVLGFGVYGFRGHPSQRVIEDWARMPIPGMFSAAFPLGIAMVLLGALILFRPPETLAPWILIPFTALVFVGMALMFWQPRWTKPPWLRRSQESSRSGVGL